MVTFEVLFYLETVWLEKKALLCFCGDTETVTKFREFQRMRKTTREAIAKSNKGVLFFPSCGKMTLTSYESSTSLTSLTPLPQKRDSDFSQKKISIQKNKSTYFIIIWK